MGYRRLNRAAQHLVTISLLVTVIITTFLPDWAQRAQAAAPAVEAGSTAAPAADTGTGRRAVQRRHARARAAQRAVLSEPGHADLQIGAVDLGGYVCHPGRCAVRRGERSGLQRSARWARRLPRAGAGAELAALSPADRDAVTVWNDDQRGAGRRGRRPGICPQHQPGPKRRSAAARRSISNQLVPGGPVAVEVVCGEHGHSRELTADEISKVKSEVVSALDWWTVVGAPDGDGTPPAGPSDLDGELLLAVGGNDRSAQRCDGARRADPKGDHDNAWMGTIAQQIATRRT